MFPEGFLLLVFLCVRLHAVKGALNLNVTQLKLDI